MTITFNKLILVIFVSLTVKNINFVHGKIPFPKEFLVSALRFDEIQRIHTLLPRLILKDQYVGKDGVSFFQKNFITFIYSN